MKPLNDDEQFLYVGSNNESGIPGINVYVFNMETGACKHLEGYSEILHSSFLAIDTMRGKLFSVCEAKDDMGKPFGAVASYDIQPDTGRLTYRNEQASLGLSPCYVSVNQEGSWLFVANYRSGNVCLLPIGDQGEIGEAADVLQHKGSGPVPKRQDNPHAHSITLDPSGKFAIAADLGTDKLYVYRIDATLGKLVPQREVSLHPGAGPRHIAFHPQGNFAYVINELDSTITVYRYQAEEGTFDHLQTVSTLPEFYGSENTTADIHLSPDGRFLYGSNRGHDSLAMFAVNVSDGTLSPVGHVSTRGKTPRNFTIAPNGRFVLVANQNSNQIVIFKRDPLTGKLDASGEAIDVPQPVFVKLARFSFA